MLNLLAVLLAASAAAPAKEPPASPAPAKAASAPAAPPAAKEGEAHAHKIPPSGISFIEDDYPGALAKARAEKKPLFVDTWATWCHSCLSMQRFVLIDAGLAPVKDAVVWLAIETESEKNRAFVEKFPVEGLPTFLVIDPVKEEIFGRWLGSSTVKEMRGFVQQNAEAWQVQQKGGTAHSPAAEAAREAERAQNKGDKEAAVKAYRRAAQLSAKDDPSRPERLDLLVNALARFSKDAALQHECVALGLAELAGVPDTTVGADFAATVAGCTDAEVLKGDAEAKKLAAAAETRLAAMIANKQAELAADDRSDLLATLAGRYDDSGRHELAVAAMEQRARLLEEAASTAPDATTAATFDAHRTDAYIYLKQLPKAEAMLSSREKEIPSDYNPAARLARVLFLEKKLPEAEAAAERALAKMTRGPRRVGILGLKGDILAAQGKSKEPALREQLEVLRGLPSTQKRPQAEAKIEAELKTLETRPGPKAELLQH